MKKKTIPLQEEANGLISIILINYVELIDVPLTIWQRIQQVLHGLPFAAMAYWHVGVAEPTPADSAKDDGILPHTFKDAKRPT